MLALGAFGSRHDCERSENGQWRRTGPEVLIVNRESAIYSTRLEARYNQLSRDVDHRTLSRFTGRSDQDYINLRGRIEDCVKEAPDVIRRRFTELSKLKTEGSHSNRYTVPFELEYHRNTNFTGRKELLHKLKSMIDEEEPRIIVLQGMGGIGKTQVLLEYVYQHHAEFSSVFWVNATSKETTTAGFRSIVQRLVDHHANLMSASSLPDYGQIALGLGISGLLNPDGQIRAEDEVNERIVAAVKRWWAQEENDNWLLVLDNIDDLESFSIRDFIPAAAYRRSLCRVEGLGRLNGHNIHDTNTLKDQGAETSAAEEVAKRLGSLPLAIDQAGTYIAARQITFQKYLSLYERNFKNIMKEKLLSTAWAYRDKTIITTWEVSFEAIKAENEEAADLLLICAFISNQDIWEDNLNRGMGWDAHSGRRLLDALNLLFSYSLAHRKANRECFHIHPIVHRWALERLGDKERAQETTEVSALLGRALSRTGYRTTSQWKYEERISPHIEHFREHIEIYLTTLPPETKYLSGILWMVEFYHDWKRHQSAEGLLLYMLEGCKETLAVDDPNTQHIMNLLGVSYRYRGLVEKAKGLLTHVLETRKRLLGDEHVNTLNTAHELFILYRDEGQLDEAEVIGMQVLEARKRILGNENKATLMSLGELAILYELQGRSAEAETLHLQALDISTRTLGEENPDTLTVLHDLSHLYVSQGRLEEAETLLLQVIEAASQTLGKEYPSTLHSMHLLAEVYKSQKRLAAAETETILL
ncbi:uncharacterized protein H6S33_008545 [Morchella sextelata]|uniref:uncharacterized protein n=1 Tax=Morchella sextelata TaxID=1174677 RepID=UPI001D039FAE|nr:uncharacterized protein H6S33_008545 [Morchella sextelata]KAH0602895.1 hypothetical protein H6S33_008545 [Morchella sextelata]